MSEQRIKALENGHVELRKEIANMASNHAELDKTLNALAIQLKDHFSTEKQFEQTIRNIDDNVKSITVRLAEGAMERHRETQIVVDPIWDTIRKHDKRFHECADDIKTEIRKDAVSHVKLIWFALIIFSGLSTYIYIDDKQTNEKNLIETKQTNEKNLAEVRKDLKQINQNIINFHTVIRKRD